MSQGTFRTNSADAIAACALATQGSRYSYVCFMACIACTTETQPCIFIPLQPTVLFGVKTTLAPCFSCLGSTLCYYFPIFHRGRNNEVTLMDKNTSQVKSTVYGNRHSNNNLHIPTETFKLSRRQLLRHWRHRRLS